MNLDLASTILCSGSLDIEDQGGESSDLIVETGTGKPNANSYISLEEANSYFSGKRLNSTVWSSASDDTKKIALKMATITLDHEVEWKGEKRFTSGSLRWPRNYVYDSDNVLVANDSVPIAVRESTAEMAMYLMSSDKFTNRTGIGLKSLKVDVITLEFDKYDKADLVPSYIRRVLVEYGTVYSNSGVKTVPLVRT